jgi:hypothetical protein
MAKKKSKGNCKTCRMKKKGSCVGRGICPEGVDGPIIRNHQHQNKGKINVKGALK